MEKTTKKNRIWPWIKLALGILVFAVLANIVYRNDGRTLTVFVPKDIPAEYSLDKNNSFPVQGETRGTGYLLRYVIAGTNKTFSVTTYQIKTDVNGQCDDGDVASFKDVGNIDLADLSVCSYTYENDENKEKNYYFNKGEHTIRIRDVNTPYLEITNIEKLIYSLEAKLTTEI
jgi:hypothetical protein